MRARAILGIAAIVANAACFAQAPAALEEARRAGRAGDAAALERLVAAGDPALVRAFDHGLALARVESMPDSVEAVVARHFDDPKVGAVLRGLSPRYRTRAVFERHLARVRAAYQGDEPSFRQILRTDQVGIEAALLEVAGKFPARPGERHPVGEFLGRRRHPGGVPLLLESLRATLPGTGASGEDFTLRLLLDYPSPEVWRRAGAEVDRLLAAGAISPEVHASARRRIDPVLADPDTALARQRTAEALLAFYRGREAILPAPETVEASRGDPPRYMALAQERLAQEEALAATLSNPLVDTQVAVAARTLGLYARFVARDTAAAESLFLRGARRDDALSQVALADLYQLERRDTARALEAYQRALDTARRPEPPSGFTPYAKPGSPMNAFWRGWLAAEVDYLRTGKAFSGPVPEAAITGFWQVLDVWAGTTDPVFPEWRGSALGSIERRSLAARLREVPASRVALFSLLPHVSGVPEARAMLSELARHDPSGYWTTVALATIEWHAARGAAGRELAARNGVAGKMPGFLAPEQPPALVAAAWQHLQSRGLRPVAR